MLSASQRKRISKYKILVSGKTRAKQLLSIMESLKESGRLNFENAGRLGVSGSEWLASCLFYTTCVSAQLPNLKEYLYEEID